MLKRLIMKCRQVFHHVTRADHQNFASPWTRFCRLYIFLYFLIRFFLHFPFNPVFYYVAANLFQMRLYKTCRRFFI